MNTKSNMGFEMKYLKFALSVIVFTIVSLSAATSVKVFSFDEGMSESNISKPHIYIQNTGTTTLTDFIFYYYFTNEEAKTPVLDDYYTPESNVSLEQISTDQYRLKYQVTGGNYAPGQSIPNTAGNVVGLHYNDWGTWNKTNDYSNNSSSTFAENTKITVYENGVLIYGSEPNSVSTGAITREVWTNISGTLISSIPVASPFNSTGTLNSLEEPQNWADNYGTRLRGYITPVSSGTYYFYIASDDQGELWLSTNDRIETKTRIAFVDGWTNYHQWDKFPTTQKSAAISLVEGQKYYVEVKHKDGTGGDNLSVGWLKQDQTGEPAVISGSVLSPFVAPNATPVLSGVSASSSQINLSWTENCTNEDGYRIERSVSGGPYNQLIDLEANTTSYQNTGLTAGTVYSYRVRAFNSQGYSALSNVFTLTTQESTLGAVTLEKWNGLSSDGEVSSIPVNQNPTTTAILTTLEEPAYNEDNFGTRVRGYITAPASGSYTFWIRGDDDCEFYLSTSTAPANASKICNVDGWTSVTEWNKFTSQKSAVKNLVAGQKYYFQILHKEGTGTNNMAVGWLKPTQSGTVPSEVIPGSVLSKFVAPVAPSNLTATAVSGSQINLVWSDNSDNEENIIIEQSIDGTTFSQVASKAPNTVNATITGLVPATTYTFRVETVNSAGSSAWSSVASTATQTTTAGAISRDIWYGIPTNQGVNGIPTGTSPGLSGSIPILQEPVNIGDAFGTRVRGYITAPKTDAYTFWISGDDDCKLFLSTDENPANKVEIASFINWTDPLQWTKFNSQKTTNPVNLVEGRRYYVEVLHLDINGNDHMAVGWSNSTQSATTPAEIIPGSVLSMFVAPAAPSALVATTVSSTQIDLSWTDNADNETGFIIEGGLAGQSFAEVGRVAAGITSYASTGLSPSSEYQFRVKAMNYAGYSAYSSTTTAITGVAGDQGGPELSPQLLSYAVYSQDLSYVNQRCVFSGGGAVGSNTLVKVDIDAVIGGDLVSGGNVQLDDRVKIMGDVTCRGTLTIDQSAPPTISGIVTESAPVTTVDIPVKPVIAYGLTDVNVEIEQVTSLAPGSYKALTIKRGGKVTFTEGIYNFKSISIANDASILFNVTIDKTIDINVETSITLDDRATLKFVDKGYSPYVKIYTNTYALTISNQVKITGILTAPHATVSIGSQTSIEGAVYAKIINFAPDAIVNSAFVDPNRDDDGDGVPTGIEMNPLIGTDPNDPASYTPVAIPESVTIDNTERVTIEYNLSRFYKSYSDLSKVIMVCPAGALKDPYQAPIIKLESASSAGSNILDTAGYSRVGLFFEILGNPIDSGATTYLSLPAPVSTPPFNYSTLFKFANLPTTCLVSDEPPGASAGLTNEEMDDLLSQSGTPMPIQGAGSGSGNYIASLAQETNGNIGNIIAYFDDGTVFSSKESEIIMNCVVTDIQYLNTGDPGNLEVLYTDLTNPGVSIPKSVPLSLGRGGETVYASLTIKAPANSFRVDRVNLNINRTTTNLSTYRNINETVSQGESYNIDIYTKENKLTSREAILYYSTPKMSFESQPLAGEGLIQQVAGTFNYSYFLKDHLGSTRMVLAQNGEVKEALMYQPYGTVSDVEGITPTGNDPLRQKFTTKEFDEEGDVENPNAVIDLNVDIAYPGNTFRYCKITIIFTDGTTEIVNIEDPVGDSYEVFKINKSFEYSTQKTIDAIRIEKIKTGLTWNCFRDNPEIQKTVALQQRISISIHEYEGNSPCAQLYVSDPLSLGIQAYHFGFRTYDPDLGIWNRPDPMNQYWNSYSYCGSNPVNLIDLWGLESDEEEEMRKKAEEAMREEERRREEEEYRRNGAYIYDPLEVPTLAQLYEMRSAELNEIRGRIESEMRYDMVMNDIKERQKEKNIYYRKNYTVNTEASNSTNGVIYDMTKIGSGVGSTIPLSEFGAYIASKYATKTYYSAYIANESGVVLTQEYFASSDLLKGANISKALKISGYTAFGVSAGFSVYEGYQFARSGNYAGVEKSMFDFGMNIVSFAYPVGTTISALYSGLDLIGVWNYNPPYNGPSVPFDVPDATRTAW
jgi:RHS repeat-associated protein